MHRFRSIRSSCLAATLVFAAAACTSNDTGVPAPAADFRSSPVDDAVDGTALPSPVVAEVRTVDGARLIFHDDGLPGGDPVISVEIASDTVTPATDAVLAAEPSALELYLATAKLGAAAPAALVRDHELLAAAGLAATEPRALAVATAVGETYGPYPCHDTRSWRNDFTSWAPVLDGEYIAASAEEGVTTGYVGYAPKFYFDVCRPYDIVFNDNTVFTIVQRRPGSSYAWTNVNSATDALDYQERRWRYYRNSWSCSSYQYRLYVSAPAHIPYRRAARWSDQWSCQIGSISS